MRTKDLSVQTIFHPALTAFLFGIDILYRDWGDECEITSGSEPETRHGRTSLHYATPCQAADVSFWRVEVLGISREEQWVAIEKAADLYCDSLGVPHNWIDIILEDDHIHIEYQPKRTESLFS